MKQAENEVARLSRALPTQEQFVELIRSYLGTVTNTKDLIEEELVYKEVVLNLRAGDDVISVIKLNPPYNLMVDLSKVSSGRESGSPTEPSFDTFFELLSNYSRMKFKLEKLQLLLCNIVKPDLEGIEFLR